MEVKEQDRKRIKYKKKPSKNLNRYSYEFKLKSVKLYLEEDYTVNFLSEQLRIGPSTLNEWVKKYRRYGEDGLRPKEPKIVIDKINPILKNEIIKTKRENPKYGICKTK